MITLIIGKKGSGKTKKLIEAVNDTAKSSLGNVVCVEKGDVLTYSVSHAVRLVDTDSYGISGYNEYYALICGIAAGNHDVTHIFGDATLKIGGGIDGLESFLTRVSAIAEDSNIRFTFTISADESELPAGALELVEKL